MSKTREHIDLPDFNQLCCVKCQDLNSENEELQNVTEKGAQKLINYFLDKHLTGDIPITTLRAEIFAEQIFAEFIFAILALNREIKFRETC